MRAPTGFVARGAGAPRPRPSRDRTRRVGAATTVAIARRVARESASVAALPTRRRAPSALLVDVGTRVASCVDVHLLAPRVARERPRARSRPRGRSACRRGGRRRRAARPRRRARAAAARRGRRRSSCASPSRRATASCSAPRRPATAPRGGIARMRFALGVDDDLRAVLRALPRRPADRRAPCAPRRGCASAAGPSRSRRWPGRSREQLIEFERAAAIQRRIVRALGPRCARTGLRDVPDRRRPRRRWRPARLERLRPRRTAARSRCVARAREVAAGRVDLRARDHERGWRRLRAIPGIGRWTVDDARAPRPGPLRPAPRRRPRLPASSSAACAPATPAARGDRGRGARALRALRALGRPGRRPRARASAPALRAVPAPRRPARSSLASALPGRNSFVSAGRRSAGCRLSSSCVEHPAPVGVPRARVLPAERLVRRRGRRPAASRSTCASWSRRRGPGWPSTSASTPAAGRVRSALVAARQRLHEAPDRAPPWCSASLAGDEHELVVGRDAGLVDADDRGLLVRRAAAGRPRVPEGAERRVDLASRASPGRG